MKHKQTYQYTNKQGNENKVYCTRLEYLYIKLNYGINGLTPKEYLEYKQLSNIADKSGELMGHLKYLEEEISFLIELLTEDQLTQYLNHQEQNKTKYQEH